MTKHLAIVFLVMYICHYFLIADTTTAAIVAIVEPMPTHIEVFVGSTVV